MCIRYIYIYIYARIQRYGDIPKLYIYIYRYIYIYIYIYIERERYVCVYVCMYIYREGNHYICIHVGMYTYRCTHLTLNLFFQTRGADAPIPVADGNGGWTIVLASGLGF